ncbi:hypothetical protein QQ056_10400 [Oscillatoria laete-virens NRMC-F 0139]|nr:hypothetical protein [Oscillatoria laete-virens]MDL5053955.1 hypothetical protein [Oscillatoria laete-virens NRMC-F 0139]
MKKQQTDPKEPLFITANVFRAIGVAFVILGIACLLLYFANFNARSHGGRNLTPMLVFTAYCIPVGVGMLFLRKVFALLIALPCLAVAVWLGAGSIFYVPFPWMLINIAFACILCLPSYFTVIGWKQLR